MRYQQFLQLFRERCDHPPSKTLILNAKQSIMRSGDLIQVARDAVSDIELSIEETNGHVEIGEPITMNVNPDQIRKVFRDRIGNAVKFSRKDEPPLVKVSGKTGNGTYRIFVEDNGIGFQEELC